MLILGICGSLRSRSFNRALLRAAASLLPSPHLMNVLVGIDSLPHYNEEIDCPTPGEEVRALREAIARSDALVIATPEYNGSISGALKNALDWASRPFPDNCLRGKPTLVIGATSGIFGAVWAQADLRRILMTAGADVLSDQLPPVRAEDAFDARLRLTDSAIAESLDRALDALIERSRKSAVGRTSVVDRSGRRIIA